MKKLFTLLLALTMLSALLCGCGTTTTADTPEDAQSENQAETNQQTEGTGGATEAPEAGTAEEMKTVTVTADSTPEVKELYALSNFSVTTPAAGESFQYLKTAEDGANPRDWDVPEGFVPVAIRMTVQNQEKEPVCYAEEMGGILFFESGGTYVTQVLQENPGQKDEDGNVCPSAEVVPLEKGKSAVIWLIGNVPQEKLNSGEGFRANFILNDSTVYDIDLRGMMG